MWTQRASHHPIIHPGPLRHALSSQKPLLPLYLVPKVNGQDTHIGPSQAAELVLQVAGEVIGFLDGGARPWISCAIKSWHCREVPQHRA